MFMLLGDLGGGWHIGGGRSGRVWAIITRIDCSIRALGRLASAYAILGKSKILAMALKPGSSSQLLRRSGGKPSKACVGCDKWMGGKPPNGVGVKNLCISGAGGGNARRAPWVASRRVGGFRDPL